jgi:hypothetical protein
METENVEKNQGQEPKKTISKTADEIMDFIADIGKDIPNDRQVLVGYLATLERVGNWLHGQTQHVEKSEADYIKLLYKDGFSMGDIALIVDRSKSTIHEVIERP